MLADVNKRRTEAETHFKNALTALEQALKLAKMVETAYGTTLGANAEAPPEGCMAGGD